MTGRLWSVFAVTSRSLGLFITVYGVGLVVILGLAQLRGRLTPETWARGVVSGHDPRHHQLHQHPSHAELQDLQIDSRDSDHLQDFSKNIPLTESGEPYKVILFWNPFFRAQDFRFGFGHQPFLDANCSVNTCMTTDDKGVLDLADAVLTHGPVVDPIPPKPLPHQRYVYVQGEPHWDISNDLLPELYGYYNLTMTYRIDSDIRLPYAVIDHNPEQAKPEPANLVPQKKMKSVVWVVSHCETPSQREQYARELMKHIDVVIYGDCGSLHCPKDDNPKCRELFEKHFHFFLSFENDVCQDYASEKLYHPLRYNIVPIVYGGANYTHDTPPHSVIDVMDYQSPKQLATYLKSLIRNRAEYAEYLKWKYQGYDIEMDRRTIMAKSMCRLCEILHEEDYQYRDYADIWRWWVDDKCDPKAMAKLKRKW